jgi:hypothetical protein
VKHLGLKVFLTSLMLLSSLLIGLWHSGHIVIYSATAPDALISRERIQKEAAGRWTLVHTLASRCACSRTLIQHLTHRKPLPDTFEKILLVDASKEHLEELQSAGFSVEVLNSENMIPNDEAHPENSTSKMILQGLPSLSVMNPKNEVLYIGGYTSDKISSQSELHDVEILKSLQSHHDVIPYAIRGCSVSKKYWSIMNPESYFKLSQKESDL